MCVEVSAGGFEGARGDGRYQSRNMLMRVQQADAQVDSLAVWLEHSYALLASSSCPLFLTHTHTHTNTHTYTHTPTHAHTHTHPHTHRHTRTKTHTHKDTA